MLCFCFTNTMVITAFDQNNNHFYAITRNILCMLLPARNWIRNSVNIGKIVEIGWFWIELSIMIIKHHMIRVPCIDVFCFHKSPNHIADKISWGSRNNERILRNSVVFVLAVKIKWRTSWMMLNTHSLCQHTWKPLRLIDKQTHSQAASFRFSMHNNRVFENASHSAAISLSNQTLIFAAFASIFRESK